jgi:hypothetical protein
MWVVGRGEAEGGAGGHGACRESWECVLRVRGRESGVSYNLLEERWIPVLRTDGKTCRVGIRGALMASKM